jgi:hypothetical protein
MCSRVRHPSSDSDNIVWKSRDSVFQHAMRTKVAMSVVTQGFSCVWLPAAVLICSQELYVFQTNIIACKDV